MKRFYFVPLLENNHYVVWRNYKYKNIFIFKKTTASGYNFIDPLTNNPLFKNNIYMNKRTNDFYLTSGINISENLYEANTEKSKVILRLLKMKNLMKSFVN